MARVKYKFLCFVNLRCNASALRGISVSLSSKYYVIIKILALRLSRLNDVIISKSNMRPVRPAVPKLF